MRQSRTTASRQQGLVLVIALIMLLAVTLMVVSASNLVQANLKVVQNAESRELARAAALAALEEAMSDRRFADTPDAIFSNTSVSCVNVAGLGDVVGQCVTDYNGDGQDDVTVSVDRPICVSVTVRTNDSFDYLAPTGGDFWTCQRKGPLSRCADAVWEFRATATDDATGASVFVRQGVAILTKYNDVGFGPGSKCPI